MAFKMLQNTLKNLYFRLKYTLHLETKNNVEHVDKSGNTNLGSDLSQPQPQDRIASQLKPLIKILHYVGGYPIAEKSLKPNSISRQSIGVNTKQIGIGYTENINDIIVGSSPGELFDVSENYIFEKLENIKVDKHEPLEVDLVDEDIGKYEITKWTSVVTWYSYIVKIITFLSVFIFPFNMVLDIPFPLRLFSLTSTAFTSAATQNITHASMGIIAILKLVEMIILLRNSGGFVDWINRWSVFEMDFWHCFGFGKSNKAYYFKFDITYFRNVVILCYLVIPGLCWAWGMFSSIYLVKKYNLQYQYLSGFVYVAAMFGMWGNPLLEDTKIIILFRTSVLALRQIRLGIKERCLSPKFPLTPDDVIGWRNLIASTRSQTAIACNYIKSQQLIFIAETISVCSLGLGFIATVIGESELSSKVAAPLFITTGYYCFSNIVRLYVKVMLAEQIPAEELRLAGDIFEIDGKCNEAASKIELKFLHKLLAEQTVQVNMGNYFTMNKKLLLQIGVQVVTYLIVIMQFKGAAGQGQQ